MPKSELNALTLLAIFIAGPLAGRVFPPDPWTSLLAGVSLLVLLLSFDRDAYRTPWQSVAFGATAGFCVMLASPAILQYLGLVPFGQISAGLGPSAAIVVQTQPFPWLSVIWVVAAILFSVVDRSRMGTRAPLPETRPTAPVPGGVTATLFRPQQPPPSSAYQPQTYQPQSYQPQTYQPPPYQPPAPAYEPRPEPLAPATPPAPPQSVAPLPATAVFSQAPVSSPPPPPPPLAPEPQHYAPPTPQAPPAPAPASPPPNAVPFPTGMGKPAVIFLNLVGEGLPVLRSVQAEHVGKDYYLIVEPVPPGERWQFQPGQIVRCQKKNLSNGKAMVAVEEAPRAS